MIYVTFYGLISFVNKNDCLRQQQGNNVQISAPHMGYPYKTFHSCCSLFVHRNSAKTWRVQCHILMTEDAAGMRSREGAMLR